MFSGHCEASGDERKKKSFLGSTRPECLPRPPGNGKIFARDDRSRPSTPRAVDRQKERRPQHRLVVRAVPRNPSRRASRRQQPQAQGERRAAAL